MPRSRKAAVLAAIALIVAGSIPTAILAALMVSGTIPLPFGESIIRRARCENREECRAFINQRIRHALAAEHRSFHKQAGSSAPGTPTRGAGGSTSAPPGASIQPGAGGSPSPDGGGRGGHHNPPGGGNPPTTTTTTTPTTTTTTTTTTPHPAGPPPVRICVKPVVHQCLDVPPELAALMILFNPY